MQCRDTDLGNDSILQQWSYIKSQMMDRCLFPGGYHLTISKRKGQLLDELKRNTWFLKRYTAIAESHNCVIIRSPRLFQERIFRNHFDKLRMQSAIFHEKHKHNYAWPQCHSQQNIVGWYYRWARHILICRQVMNGPSTFDFVFMALIGNASSIVPYWCPQTSDYDCSA